MSEQISQMFEEHFTNMHYEYKYKFNSSSKVPFFPPLNFAKSIVV